MRVVLADLKSHRGFVSKDTVVGGYGSRLEPFSRVTAVAIHLKKQFHDVPSVHMAYLAAILVRAGHEVKWTRGEMVEGDLALVLSSLVDHKSETKWADAMRARGVKPWVLPAASEPIRTAAAPSTIPDELPAWCTWLMRGTCG